MTDEHGSGLWQWVGLPGHFEKSYIQLIDSLYFSSLVNELSIAHHVGGWTITWGFQGIVDVSSEY